ncbi:TetR/AcrR family transcriptional regulator [Gordonia aurantiaca]|uniref:TetR/AcrR family transcriptional regulator n=1 Tax=Gordonia sp. B21 TaxID=3151852 RepID=UPI00326701BF
MTTPANSSAPTQKRGRPPVAGLAEKRRGEIVEAAYKVFTGKGYEATTIADVAREAGIGQGTIYRYIESKRELLDLVFDNAIDRLFSTVDPDSLFDSDPQSLDDMAAKITTIGRRLYRLIDEDPALIRLIAVQANAIDKDLRERVVGLEAILNSLVVRALGIAVDRGWVEVPDERRPILARLLTSLTIPGVVASVEGKTDPALRDLLVGTATDVARRGIVARQAGR